MARLVFIGLSITSSWGNGHATTYRALIKALAARGHDVTFLEQDQPWYAEHRDLPQPPYCRANLYTGVDDLFERFADEVRDADAVIIGSYVHEAVSVTEWALRVARGPIAFYDIDTPVTLAALEAGQCSYLDFSTLGRYDLYLSFTGGPVLRRLKEMGARQVAPLYCSVDPAVHAPRSMEQRWDLGYLGTYSDDRQPGVEAFLLEPARLLPLSRFTIAGAQYPEQCWPENLEHIAHLPPQQHAAFYCSQRFTLNVTRAAMRTAGWSPSVRLFEAAACGTPVISDHWPGLEDFFKPGREIFCVETTEDVLALLTLTGSEAAVVAAAARSRVLGGHTADHRAAQLEVLLDAAAHGTSASTTALVSHSALADA